MAQRHPDDKPLSEPIAISLAISLAAILAGDIFKCIFLGEKVSILINVSLKSAPNGQIDNNPSMV